MKLLSALVVFAALAAAQTTRGVIGGTVKDASGKPVGQAEVTLTSEGTNAKRTTTSDAQGDFTFTLVAPGKYSLETQGKGFNKLTLPVTLEVGQDVRIGVVLSTGASAEVTASAGLLRTDTSTLGGVITPRQVQMLPLDGRNFYELSLLLPGVLPAAQGSAGSVRGDFAVQVNGAREDSNNFLLDGAYNGDPKLNGAALTPPVDAIREFEVATSTYDLSFGRNAGGQISVVTQSGSNRLHGTAYEFFRNEVFDERNFFAPKDVAAPRYQRNQFGFSLGGPIAKNRTFFFMDYEGRRLREGVTLVTNVPTALERTGDFSKSLAPPINPLTFQPFQGNKIPQPFLDPIGLAIAALYPLPNRAVPGANYVASPIRRDRDDRFDMRLDHLLSARDELAGRYSFGDRDLFEPYGGFSPLPGFGLNIPRRAQNAMIGETHVFAPTLLNEARVAFNRVANHTDQEGQGTSRNRLVGLPELSSNPRDFGLSEISIAGFAPLGNGNTSPQFGATNTYQISDIATWSRGRHLVKFGFDQRFLQQNAFRDVESRGFIQFTGFTGNALAEMLTDLVSVTGGAKMDNPQHLRSHSSNFFVQDTWRARPNLSVNFGVRYEYNSPAVDAQDRANVYDPAQGKLVPVGKNGFPRAGYEPDRNNFAPQVGFAWGARSTTVIRGAYGIHYDQSSLAPGEGLYFSAPYFTLNLFIPFQGLPPVILENPFPAGFPQFLGASATAFQRDLRTPYLQHWNFGVQQRLGGSRVLEVAYVGSKGTRLFDSRDINQPLPSNAPQYVRPNRAFEDIDIIESQGNSIYHSLQTRFEQRFSHGLSALASYTYGKSIDNTSGIFSSAGDPNFPQNSRNLAAERGRSNFDVAHRFVLSYGYDLPIAKGNRLLGGWQTFGVMSFQTGQPFTVALNQDLDNSNTGRASLGFGNNDRPNVVRNPELSNPTPARWFDTSAFVIPARGNFGNAGRNILDGPGLANVNFSVVKNTAFSERFTMQLRAEFFNLFNRDNFNLPDAFVGSPTFGQVTSAQSPRRVQLALKFLF